MPHWRLPEWNYFLAAREDATGAVQATRLLRERESHEEDYQRPRPPQLVPPELLQLGEAASQPQSLPRLPMCSLLLRALHGPPLCYGRLLRVPRPRQLAWRRWRFCWPFRWGSGKLNRHFSPCGCDGVEIFGFYPMKIMQWQWRKKSVVKRLPIRTTNWKRRTRTRLSGKSWRLFRESDVFELDLIVPGAIELIFYVCAAQGGLFYRFYSCTWIADNVNGSQYGTSIASNATRRT